jgi:hypothetical protein
MTQFNTPQKVTIVIFTTLSAILIANQLINNFDFTL